MTRRAATQKDAQEQKTPEHRFSEYQTDDLHREIGERLTAGVLGVFDLLANLGSRSNPLDQTALIELARQAISLELQPLHLELRDIRAALDEIRSGIDRLEKAMMQRMLRTDAVEGTDETRPATGRTPATSGRAPRTVVIDRVFNTAQRLIDEGVDIRQMTSTALAHEAGVKPTQFTYAFKTRDNFMAQFVAWQGKQSA